MPEYKVTVDVSGPLSDGRAEGATERFVRKATTKLGETGRDWIRIEALGFDISGRGGTGRAAAGVLLFERDYGALIFGEMKEGEVWWPWLEGVSERNRTTRFKGYHTFRRTRRKLEDNMMTIIRPELEELRAEIGGP
jgi:hypothetical protein